MDKPILLPRVSFERVINKNVSPKPCYKAFFPITLWSWIGTFFFTTIAYVISQTLYQNLYFKMLKELSCSCKVQSFEKDKCWYFSLSDFYLFCKKTNRRLESNDTGFLVHLSIKKEVRLGYGGGGGHVFFVLYTLNLPYIIFILYFHPKNSYFPIKFWSKVAWHTAY